MKSVCSQFLLEESGATAIEYGLIASGIALAIMGSVHALSDTVKTLLFDVIAAALT
jgi:pilus assembly protein Flp/PilA